MNLNTFLQLTGINLKSLLQILGLISSILFFVAGIKMIGLESISGDSVAEIYYQSVGWLSFGLSVFSGALLLGIAEIIDRVTNNSN